MKFWEGKILSFGRKESMCVNPGDPLKGHEKEREKPTFRAIFSPDWLEILLSF